MSQVKKKVVPKVPSRGRIWCFTINNPDEKEQSHLSHPNFLENVKSLIWQLEVGEKNTPHIQGVVQFNNQILFAQVKKKLPTAHIEICRNFPASKSYCQKKSGRLEGPFIYPGPVKKLTSREISELMRSDLIPGHITGADYGEERALTLP